MSKDHKAKRKYSYTQNREISWLRFNRRVLEEAADRTVPPLERLKFVSIFSTNLDEFFMVRVGSLHDLSVLHSDYIDNKSGMTAAEQLEEIYRIVPGLIERKRRIYKDVVRELEKSGIRDVAYDKLTGEEREYVDCFYDNKILPILSPQVVDKRHPKPKFKSKRLYIASFLRDRQEKKALAFIPIPKDLPAVLMLDISGRYIRTEEILLHRASELYTNYSVRESCVISVTRNADVSFDSEKFEDSEADVRSEMEKLLKKRDVLAIMRLEISDKISDAFGKDLMKLTGVKKRQVFVDKTPLNMKAVFALEEKLPAELRKMLSYSPYQPQWPANFDQRRSMMQQIREKDKLLFFPFDSVEPFIRLLNEAADDPEVVSIKISIYRLASSSKIVRALCRAAENGKEVTALMELRARFDEENNILWSKMLEDAGCKVIYGIDNYKCHSKICLITALHGGQYRYITQIGTGNYNEKTNAMYTDISIMTASEEIGKDGTAFFRNMLMSNVEGAYSDLLVAPTGMSSPMMQMIEEEMEKGEAGYIRMKVNAITDRTMIDKLAKASEAGVKIDLLVRGICCLKPGITEETENIRIISIVGRYLEHARIYCFGRGRQAKIFISSADLMTRNLRRRIEIAAPVYDEDIRQELLHILDVEFADTAKASEMQQDGSYIRLCEGEKTLLDSQQIFMDDHMLQHIS